jgi:energy-coupling factor transporter ATP-binding protein EcfA2
MLVVNLFGAPSSGKSTLALLVAGVLKTKYPHLTTECPDEIAKMAVYDGALKGFGCQIYVAGQQQWQVARCEGHADIVVCDSPIMLSWVYGTDQKQIVPNSFFDVARFYHNAFPSLNFHVKRNHAFETKARMHNESDAARLDASILKMLRTAEITAFPVTSTIEDAKRIAAMAVQTISDPEMTE